MKNIDTQAHTLNELNIEVDFEELTKKIRAGAKRPDILAYAKKTLHGVKNIWRPSIVYRWQTINQSETEPGKSIIHSSNCTPVVLDLGHSNSFLKKASYVLVAIYSAGRELEKETQKSSKTKEPLVAFLLDLIGLLVLEKTGDIVKRLAEQKAAEHGWGVSPFLSPGSIHGWKLEDQINLCSLLPLDEIDVQIQDNAVLIPFKSLSCLIGIGPGYEARSVGSTCDVCLNNKHCEMGK